MIYTGVAKYRGESDIKEEFAGLEVQFPNLENKRTLKDYNTGFAK